MPRNLQFLLRRHHLNPLRRQPKKLEPCSRTPNPLAVLSNPAGKNQKINSAQKRDISSDHLAYRDRKDIKRQPGLRIVRTRPLLQNLHVALARRKT